MKNIYERFASKVNYYLAPGLPDNKLVIFEGDNVYTDESPMRQDRKAVEDYVNYTVFPWAFMNGIYCTGIDHGNFVRNRHYCKAIDVPKKKEEDYDFNVDILNYAMAIMVASEEHAKGKTGITMVEYVGEADMCVVYEYPDEKAFEADVKEWLEEVEDEENDC